MAKKVSPVGINQEILDSISFLHEGIHVLARGYSHRFAVAALNISTGLERLMKMLLVLDDLHHNRPLNQNFYRHQLSHDIEACFSAVTDRNLWAAADTSPPIWSMPNVVSLVEIFKLSSGSDRYAYFDDIFSNSPTLDTPERYYQRFLTQIGETMPGYNEALGTPAFQSYIDATRQEGVATVQRIARALCRAFTLGPIKETARVYSGLLSPFLFLRDHELGAPLPLPDC